MGASLVAQNGREFVCNARDPGLIPGLERSPGGRNGNPLQYSGLESSMDCKIHAVAESDTTERLHFKGK